jgi:hypothetical protein
MSMGTSNQMPIGKRAKSDSASSIIERQIRKFIPSLEELIVRKTQAERRRALFGKDPFLG